TGAENYSAPVMMMLTLSFAYRDILWICLRRAPGSAADIGFIPVRIARVQAVGIRLALGGRITVLEAERDRLACRNASDRGSEGRSFAGVQLTATTAAKTCRRDD